MKCKIIRIAEGKNSTLSQLYINGIFQCYLLEDKIRAIKVMRETAIPTGNFKLKLNTWGAMNIAYERDFKTTHKGMIEIDSLPNFKSVYIHIGNTISETAGCPLTGFGFQLVNSDYQVTQSKTAYSMVYPKLVSIAQSSENDILIENNFQF